MLRLKKLNTDIHIYLFNEILSKIMCHWNWGNSLWYISIFYWKKISCRHLKLKIASEIPAWNEWKIVAMSRCIFEYIAHIYVGCLFWSIKWWIFLSPARRSGSGGYWRRLGCPSGRPSGRPSVPRPDVRISFPEQNSVTRAWISLIFDTHIP